LNYISSLFYPPKLLRYKKICFLEDSVKEKAKERRDISKSRPAKGFKGGGGRGRKFTNSTSAKKQFFGRSWPTGHWQFPWKTRGKSNTNPVVCIFD
jgi:hypothetical protein